MIRNPLEVSYDKIEKFPKTQVKGHPGRLIFGQIAGKDVVSNVKYYISFCSIKKLSLRLPTIKLGWSSLGDIKHGGLQFIHPIFKLISPSRPKCLSKTFCFDPHFSGEGGTIYSTGIFFVQSILADRYIHRRELWVVSLKNPSRVEYGIKKIFSIFVFYR